MSLPILVHSGTERDRRDSIYRHGNILDTYTSLHQLEEAETSASHQKVFVCLSKYGKTSLFLSDGEVTQALRSICSMMGGEPNNHSRLPEGL